MKKVAPPPFRLRAAIWILALISIFSRDAVFAGTIVDYDTRGSVQAWFDQNWANNPGYPGAFLQFEEQQVYAWAGGYQVFIYYSAYARSLITNEVFELARKGETYRVIYVNDPQGPCIGGELGSCPPRDLPTLDQLKQRLRDGVVPRPINFNNYTWPPKHPSPGGGVRGSLKGPSLTVASPDYMLFVTPPGSSGTTLRIPFFVDSIGDADWLEFAVNGEVFFRDSVVGFVTGQWYEIEVPSVPFGETSVFSYYLNSAGALGTSIFFPMEIVPDTDDDNIPNDTDNCTLKANPAQVDSDHDGFGNACDGDLNNNGATNGADTTLYRQQLGQPSVAPTYNKADINGNGVVNASDTTLYRQMLGTAPGPSGLGCAGTVPCPVP